MSQDSTDTVQYRREVPIEWESLAAHAQSMADRAVIFPEHVEAIYDSVNTLGDEALETNYYYGSGLVMCGVARALQRPEIRQRVVDKAAVSLVRWRNLVSPEGRGVRVDDIGSEMMGMSFVSLAEDASSQLPRGIRLLTETLAVINIARNLDDSSPLSVFTAQSADSRDSRVNRIPDGNCLAQVIGVSATGGIALVMKHVLKLKGGDMAADGTSPYIAGIVDNDALRSLITLKVAVNCAGLRIDEIKGGELHVVLGLDVDKNATFIRNKLASTPPPLEDGRGIDGQKLLREKRLGCPAVQVAGLIPTILDIFPEIIIKADSIIRKQ
ncbi:MAG: hypothetical protein JWL85_682 [Candidatus Saccharibacteria bacterium]|nr:hypothetical protein [Candidatus Saccharibacteria bacterium]